MADDIHDIDFEVNLLQSILWQHESSPNLVQLARDDQHAADSLFTEFWKDWYKNFFNLLTVNRAGAMVWSRILGFPITIYDAHHETEPRWGFGINHQNFGNGNFGNPYNYGYGLNVDEARLLLLLRYVKLTGSTSLRRVNELLRRVFVDNRVVMVDNQDMSITVYFEAPPRYELRRLLERMDVFPRPGGVSLTFSIQDGDDDGRQFINFDGDNPL